MEVDGSSIAWLYDNAYRLEREERFDNTQTPITYTEFEYDDGGNRTEVDEDGLSTLYTYNDDDQIITAGTATYTYDERGNLATITDGSDVTTYGFDARNRLETVTLPDTTSVSNDYDHDGRRISQTVNSTDTNYLWDEGSRYGDVVLETDSGGNALASYVLAGDRLVSQERGSTTHYFAADGQGSTRALINGTADVTDTYDYTAYGTLYDSFSSTLNSYLYTGQQFDAATGLYSLRARFYDPSAGRFLSRDTWRINTFNPIELNRYGYVANNPINHSDPSGHTLGETGNTTFKSVLATRLITGAAGGFVFSSLFVLLANNGMCGKQRFSTTQALLFIGLSTLFGAGFGAIGGVIKALPILYPTISAAEAQMIGALFNIGMGALVIATNKNEGLCDLLVDAAGWTAIASGGFQFLQTGFNNFGGGGMQPSTVGAGAGGGAPTVIVGADAGAVVVPGIGVDGIAGTTVAAGATATTTTTGGGGGGGEDETVYRGMEPDSNDGLPTDGQTAKNLGPRPTVDIPVDSDGMVHPGTGGMSVSRETPYNLQDFRRPPEWEGTANWAKVYEFNVSDLPPELQWVPDSPDHGTIQPSRSMTLQEYQNALRSTRNNWNAIEP